MSETQIAQEPEIARRKFFERTLKGGAAALLALAGCRRKVEETIQSQPSEPPQLPSAVAPSSEPPKSPSPAEIPEEFKIMPKVNFTNRKIEHSIPPGIQITQEDFIKISQQLGQQIAEMAEHRKKEIDVAISEDDRQQVMLNFIIQMAETAASMHPEFKKYLDQKFGLPEGGKRNFVEIAQWLNPLLVPGGHYIQASMGAKFNPATQEIRPSPSLEFYTIFKEQVVELTDQQGTESSDVFSLSKPIFQTEEVIELGFYDPELDAGFVISEELAARGKENLRKAVYGVGLEQKIDAEKIGSEYVRDTFVHEATHPFIGKRFPHFGRKNTIDTRIFVPVEEELEGLQIPLHDNYLPIHFQEMCAVGNELFQSESNPPLSLMNYLNIPEDPASGYLLIARLLPLIVLKVAPDSDLKKEIIARMKGESSGNPEGHEAVINRSAFVRLVLETFKPEHVKKVGAYLYTRGKHFFDQLE